jgi:hypothetical protein
MPDPPPACHETGQGTQTSGVLIKGSRARFRTDYKVQLWDPHNLAWHDIQRAFASIAEARSAYPPGRRCRVMEVTPRGRQPIE